jgi:hypothetical protein
LAAALVLLVLLELLLEVVADVAVELVLDEVEDEAVPAVGLNVLLPGANPIFDANSPPIVTVLVVLLAAITRLP